MSDRIKLYIVTTIGVLAVDDPNDPTKEGHTYSVDSEIEEAQSRDIVEAMVRERADEIWSKDLPWKLRAFAINPLAHTVAEGIVMRHRLGLLAGPHEPLEESVLLDIDKPGYIYTSPFNALDRPPS